MAEQDNTQADPWEQQVGESRQAYAAFCDYYQLPPRIRSLNEAYRGYQRDRRASWRERRGIEITAEEAAEDAATIASMTAPGQWRRWSTAHEWVNRTAAWDAHVNDQLEAAWIERREVLRQQDWDLGQAFRDIVREGLEEARRFIRSHVERIPAENGQPAQIIITQTFDVTGLALVAEKASKLQRLATGEATENTRWTGSTLDKLIEQELARLANGSQTGIVGAPSSPEAASE